MAPALVNRFAKTCARAPRGLERSAAATNRWRDDRWALRASLSAEKARAMMGSSHRAPSTTRPRRGVEREALFADPSLEPGPVPRSGGDGQPGPGDHVRSARLP